MKKLNVIYRAERMPAIDRYTIESTIGSGATSIVKLAKSNDSGTK